MSKFPSTNLIVSFPVGTPFQAPAVYVRTEDQVDPDTGMKHKGVKVYKEGPATRADREKVGLVVGLDVKRRRVLLATIPMCLEIGWFETREEVWSVLALSAQATRYFVKRVDEPLVADLRTIAGDLTTRDVNIQGSTEAGRLYLDLLVELAMCMPLGTDAPVVVMGIVTPHLLARLDAFKGRITFVGRDASLPDAGTGHLVAPVDPLVWLGRVRPASVPHLVIVGKAPRAYRSALLLAATRVMAVGGLLVHNASDYNMVALTRMLNSFLGLEDNWERAAPWREGWSWAAPAQTTVFPDAGEEWTPPKGSSEDPAKGVPPARLGEVDHNVGLNSATVRVDGGTAYGVVDVVPPVGTQWMVQVRYVVGEYIGGQVYMTRRSGPWVRIAPESYQWVVVASDNAVQKTVGSPTVMDEDTFFSNSAAAWASCLRPLTTTYFLLMWSLPSPLFVDGVPVTEVRPHRAFEDGMGYFLDGRWVMDAHDGVAGAFVAADHWWFRAVPTALAGVAAAVPAAVGGVAEAIALFFTAPWA